MANPATLYREKLSLLGMAPVFGGLLLGILILFCLTILRGGPSSIISVNAIPLWIGGLFFSALLIYHIIAWIGIAVTSTAIEVQSFPLQRKATTYPVTHVADVVLVSVDTPTPWERIIKPYLSTQLGYEKRPALVSYSFSLVGGHGVLLTLTSGIKVFISSYYPQRLAAVIEEARNTAHEMQ